MALASRHGCNGHYCHLEARLVYSGKRHLGMYPVSYDFIYFRAKRIPSFQNVLAGALFSPIIATLFLTTLTTIGSICATLLATPLAPFLTYLFPRALDMTRTALHGESDNPQDDSTTEVHKSKSSAWVRLSVLRLVGVVPWSGINIACGVCGVSLGDCVMGAFIGCLPWTAVTCQVSF